MITPFNIPSCMKLHFTLLSTLLFFALAPAHSEVFVDANAASGGDGTVASPFQTITAGLKATPPGGGVITVKSGVYEEEIMISQGGTADNPLHLRAAPGEMPVISGFKQLTGWMPQADGNHRMVSDEPILDLFVGGQRQRVSRFPDVDQSWLNVLSVDPEKRTFALENLPEIPADEQQDLYVLIFCNSIAWDQTFKVANIDPTQKTITVSGGGEKFPVTAGDSAVLLNAPSFVNQNGEWSAQKKEDGYHVVFRPGSVGELKDTQNRVKKVGVRIRDQKASHVVLEGLEITGFNNAGIHASGASDLKISKCVVYANGGTGKHYGKGVAFDNCTNVVFEDSIIFANHLNGVSIVQGGNILVQRCEIAANDGDGITFSGRGNQPEAPLVGVTLRNCYIHRHFYLAHPDNTQIHSHVRDVTFDGNALLLAGQNCMVQECEGMRFVDNLFLGAGARHVILGHNSSDKAEFRGNTFAFAQYGAIGTDAKEVSITDNVFYHAKLNYQTQGVNGDRNLFWSSGPKDLPLSVTFPKHQSFGNPAEFAAAVGGSELNSKVENPDFANVPIKQIIGLPAFANGATNSLALKPQETENFETGTVIEINADGVPRTVESVGEASITFSPALPTIPFRSPFIWIWKSGKDINMNLDSKLVGGDDQPGSKINLASYQRGELEGAGIRTLPELSARAKAAMPNPSTFVFPFSLPLE